MLSNSPTARSFLRDPFPFLGASAAMLACTAVASLSAGEASNLLRPPPLERHRFSVSYQTSWNISARFGNSAPFESGVNVGPATGGQVDRVYDDGFVRVDSTGNAGNTTTFWGYDNAGQAPGNDTLVLSATRGVPGSVGSGERSEPQHGFEFRYNGDLGALGKRGTWGLESAFAYTRVDISDSGPRVGRALRISDAFGLNGIVIPSAPYSGQFGVPGPLLTSVPGSRTVTEIAGGVQSTGERQYEADVYGMRLGPFFEFPLGNRFHVSASAGLAVAVVNGIVNFDELTTVVGHAPVREVGHAQNVNICVGGYVGTTLGYSLTERSELFTGLQFLHLGHFQQRVGNQRAILDLDSILVWSTGYTFQF